MPARIMSIEVIQHLRSIIYYFILCLMISYFCSNRITKKNDKQKFNRRRRVFNINQCSSSSLRRLIIHRRQTVSYLSYYSFYSSAIHSYQLQMHHYHSITNIIENDIGLFQMKILWTTTMIYNAMNVVLAFLYIVKVNISFLFPIEDIILQKLFDLILVVDASRLCFYIP